MGSEGLLASVGPKPTNWVGGRCMSTIGVGEIGDDKLDGRLNEVGEVLSASGADILRFIPGRRGCDSVGLPRTNRSALDRVVPRLPPLVTGDNCVVVTEVDSGVVPLRYLSRTRSSRKNGVRTGFTPYTFFFVRPCTCCNCVTRLGGFSSDGPDDAKVSSFLVFEVGI